MTCPECGAIDQNGNYCGECGAALRASCPECGHEAGPGARYCTACGTGLGTATARGAGLRTGWIIAAAALLVVVLVLFLPRRAERVPAPGAGASANGAPFGQGAAAPGALSPDMRTNADRLFNRVMAAAEREDRVEVERFIPMAIQAYELVEDLDNDGLYHLAILHATAGDPEAAGATAERILDGTPDHILALGVAAMAAEAGGDEDGARAYWQRLLDAYPEEATQPRPEYLDHEPILTQYRSAARQALGS